MPNSVPLRDMAVTMVEAAMPLTGSMIALPIAIAMLRKNWSLPPMKAKSCASVALSGAARGERGRRVEIRRPALVEYRSGDGAAQRPAHRLPGERRSGMEDDPRPEAGDEIAGALHVDEHRLGLLHPAQRLAIGGIDEF